MGNGQKSSGDENAAARSGKGSFIAAKCKLEGTFSFSGPLTVSGALVGNVSTDGMVIVEIGGSIIGDVTAPIVIVQGLVKGDVIASDSLEVWSGSELEGKIHAGKVRVDAGSKLTAEMSVASGTPEWVSDREAATEPEVPETKQESTAIPGSRFARRIASLNE